MKSLILEVDNELKTIVYSEIIKEDDESLETKNALYPKTELLKYIDVDNKRVVYFTEDVPVNKIEMNKIKVLGKNTVLKTIFDFERTKPKIDWFKMMPYLIIIMLVLFK